MSGEKLTGHVLKNARPIIDAHEAVSRAANAQRLLETAVKNYAERPDVKSALRRSRSATRAAWEHLYKLQDEACAQFAASRGWRVYKGAQVWISTGQLAAGRMTQGKRCLYSGGYPGDIPTPTGTRVLDHRQGFVRTPAGKTSQQSCRYPVAILSHTYGPWEDCVEYAEHCGLDIERLPHSWYYPEEAIAALFITKATL